MANGLLGGEMAERVRAHDWAATTLGPIEDWPQSLKTVVDLLLASGFPMVALWGPQLIQIYNDGYCDLMGGKHPAGLGQPTRECWPEVWHINEPIYERVLAGETLMFEDALYPIRRNGGIEDAWFTLSYSPLRDDGRIAGVLVTVFETTGRRQAEASLRASEEALNAANEELRASNEELQAANEELRAANEQQRATLEELEALQEEREAINEQLRETAEERERTATDLRNLIESTRIGTLFLNRALRIRRYTPALGELFNLIPEDAGRPVAHVTHRLDHPELAADCERAFNNLQPVKREVTSKDGRWFIARVLPFRTEEDRIGGTVITFTDITERKRAEEALRASEERLRMLFDTMSQGVAIMELVRDEAGAVVDVRCLEFNPAFNVLTGFDRNAVAGRRVSEVFPQHFLNFQPRLATVEGPAGSEKFEACIPETGRWFSFYATPFGGPDGFVVFYDDITERRRADEALRESNEKLARELEDTKRLQGISSLLIEEENSEALYEQILDVAMAIMGADFGSIQQLDPERGELHLVAWKNFHPESAEFWQRVSVEAGSTCGSALRHNERVIVPDVSATEMLKNSDSQPHWLLSGIAAVQSTPLTTREGQMVGMISTHWRKTHTPGERELRLLDILARQAADFFERTRAEAALRASEAKYRTLFETIDEGFSILEVIFDDQGRVIDYWHRENNPAFARMTGIHDSLGKRMSELIPDLEPEWYERLEEVYRTGEPVRIEYPVQQLNQWYTCYLSRIGEEGSPFIAAVYDDITERKRRELEQEFLLKLNDALRPLSDPLEIQRAA